MESLQDRIRGSLIGAARLRGYSTVLQRRIGDA